MYSPSKQRTALVDIGNTQNVKSPSAKRKVVEIVPGSDGQTRKKLRLDRGLDKENSPTKAMSAAGLTPTPKLSYPPRTGDETHNRGHARNNEVAQEEEEEEDAMPGHPESQDTVLDSDLPSSGSDRMPGPFTDAPDPETGTAGGIERVDDIASRIKCHLQLAMYKLKSHKEDVDYRSLVPRRLISGKVENRAGQGSVAQLQPSARSLTTQLLSPNPVASVLSNERSRAGLLQRSSSGEADVADTPIRRNYPLSFESPTASFQRPATQNKANVQSLETMTSAQAERKAGGRSLSLV